MKVARGRATEEIHMRSTFFQRYLLPGIIFQSVLIGGAYSTGREIVEYGARYGRYGLWSVLLIFIGFSLISAIAFEVARSTRSYDYRSFIRQLIGPLWPLFDLLYVAMAVITVAVVGSASGSIVEQVLGWPYWLGVVLVIAVAGALMVGGRHVIERFKTLGSVVLYSGYLLFAYQVLSQRGVQILEGFRAETPDSAGAAAAITAGILYVGYNLGTLPATFFVLDRQEKRRESLWAGLIAGLFSTLPFLLTYLCIMSFYPDSGVIDTPVPWLIMLAGASGQWILPLYGIVIFWTLIETSTGMTHAIIDRISVHLKELGRGELGRVQVAVITVTILGTAALLSRFGIIALVVRGYKAMAYGFLLLFALPLLTVGVRMLWKQK